MKSVKAPFIVDIKQDQYTTGQADSQPCDIHKGKDPIDPDISDRDF
jgi:hypothetical protein